MAAEKIAAKLTINTKVSTAAYLQKIELPNINVSPARWLKFIYRRIIEFYNISNI